MKHLEIFCPIHARYEKNKQIKLYCVDIHLMTYEISTVKLTVLYSHFLDNCEQTNSSLATKNNIHSTSWKFQLVYIFSHMHQLFHIRISTESHKLSLCWKHYILYGTLLSRWYCHIKLHSSLWLLYFHTAFTPTHLPSLSENTGFTGLSINTFLNGR